MHSRECVVLQGGFDVRVQGSLFDDRPLACDFGGRVVNVSARVSESEIICTAPLATPEVILLSSFRSKAARESHLCCCVQVVLVSVLYGPDLGYAAYSSNTFAFSFEPDPALVLYVCSAALEPAR